MIKDIENYENLYGITEDGKIWSYRSNKFLTPRKRKDGYWQIKLTVNNQSQTFLLHRLIAQTWIPNPENKPTVDHIDRNKDNNHVSNLRWATSSEQVLNENTDKVHSKKHMDKIIKMAREKNLKSIEKRDINDHTILYATYKSAEEAAIKNFNDAKKKKALQKCARGETKSSFGYWWCYK